MVQFKQTQLEQELRAKSDEIASLSRTIAASVTGGDSFCYLDLGLGDGMINTPLLTLVHQGKYPLYDVGIRIVDLEKLDLVKGDSKLEKMALVGKNLNVGNVGPSQAQPMEELQLPSADRQGYNVFISARNGFVTQLIRLQRINGYWKLATKVTRDFYEDKKSVVLLEKVDPEFPRDKTGQVQW